MAFEEHTPGDMIVNDYPVATRIETIASGQNIVRGAVLGRVTSGDKLVLSLTGASDGSEVPVAIAAIDVDATGGDVDAACYASGAFDDSKLDYGTGHDADTVALAFARSGFPIFLKTLK